MTQRPKLYPNHQHQWADRPDLPGAQVSCTICDFTVPRVLAVRDDPRATLQPEQEPA